MSSKPRKQMGMGLADRVNLERLRFLAVGLLILSACAKLSGATFLDPDLPGHLRFGLDFLETGRIAYQDPYSYMTAGSRWINHEWLAEVIFAALYRAAGPLGLIGLKLAINLMIVGLGYHHLVRGGLEPVRAAALTAVVLPLFFHGVVTVRPHLFTYLGFLLLLIVLHGVETGRRRLWLAVPLFAAWANLHGGFLAGLAVLCVWTCVRLVTSSGTRRSDVVGSCAALAATIATPYGFDLLPFLLRTATVGRPEIPEWQPLEIASTTGVVFISAVVLAVAGWWFSRRAPPLPLTMVFAVCAIAPMLASRHLPLFAAGFLVLAGGPIGHAWSRWKPNEPQRAGSLGLTAATLAGAAGLLLSVDRSVGCIQFPGAMFPYPAAAVALLDETGAAGNLATDFDWGEFVIWHLGPRVKVSIDGRRETVYSKSAYDAALGFMYGTNDGATVLDPADMALVKRTRPCADLLRRNRGWTLVYEDSTAALFARTGSVLAQKLQAGAPPTLAADGSGMCFLQ